MIDKDLRHKIKLAHEYALSTWWGVHKAIEGKYIVLGDTDVYVEATRFMAIYNNLFCLQDDLKKILAEIPEPQEISREGVNIYDFTKEAPKRRNKKKTPERTKPL